VAKTLQIVNNAYRCTVEEQDDPIVWISHAMKGAGADLDVVLRGNAVNYAVSAQSAAGLSFGGRDQTHPPKLAEDVAALTAKGVKVLVVSEDLSERGIDPGELISGVEPVERAKLPGVFADYDRVWSW
jgi:sulfur relay (sulfurtransferase) DsrF/TusC family protein